MTLSRRRLAGVSSGNLPWGGFTSLGLLCRADQTGYCAISDSARRSDRISTVMRSPLQEFGILLFLYGPLEDTVVTSGRTVHLMAGQVIVVAPGRRSGMCIQRGGTCD